MKLEIFAEEIKSHIADFARTEAKDASIAWLRDEALPAVREVAAAYTAALRETSGQETGWRKFRDRVFLPCAVDGVLWLLGKALDRMAAKQGG